jgi:hypothetical protein
VDRDQLCKRVLVAGAGALDQFVFWNLATGRQALNPKEDNGVVQASGSGGLPQPPANRCRDVRGDARADRRQTVQKAEHLPQAQQHAAALLTVVCVALQASSRSSPEFAVEVSGHVARSPAVIEPETRATEYVAHLSSDPGTIQTGSQTCHTPRELIA